LGFVHVADAPELLVAVGEDVRDNEASITSEEEWHDDDLIRALPSALSLMEGSPASDEENE